MHPRDPTEPEERILRFPYFETLNMLKSHIHPHLVIVHAGRKIAENPEFKETAIQALADTFRMQRYRARTHIEQLVALFRHWITPNLNCDKKTSDNDPEFHCQHHAVHFDNSGRGGGSNYGDHLLPDNDSCVSASGKESDASPVHSDTRQGGKTKRAAEFHRNYKHDSSNSSQVSANSSPDLVEGCSLSVVSDPRDGDESSSADGSFTVDSGHKGTALELSTHEHLDLSSLADEDSKSNDRVCAWRAEVNIEQVSHLSHYYHSYSMSSPS